MQHSPIHFSLDLFFLCLFVCVLIKPFFFSVIWGCFQTSLQAPHTHYEALVFALGPGSYPDSSRESSFWGKPTASSRGLTLPESQGDFRSHLPGPSDRSEAIFTVLSLSRPLSLSLSCYHSSSELSMTSSSALLYP